ncbi:MAG: M28 family peptidase [Acidobacteria bacterium]|nr:M28 family peptidase [Acidobacteriota bacterium]
MIARNAALFAVLLLCLCAQAQQKLSGQRAYTFTKQFVEGSGPRWLGSPGHTKAENILRKHFAPEKAKGHFGEDAFTVNTSLGTFVMRNFIAKYPGKKDGIIVIATHYETNIWLRDTGFVGANDGGATTGLLMELGTYLRTHPPQGYSIWLLFDDGEESMQRQWNDNEALYGTRHAAARWSADGTLNKIKAFIVTDMIGDKDLNLNLDDNSTPWLRDILRQAAKNTGHSGSVFKRPIAVVDDHIPFKERGVPVLDMIDLDYGQPSFSHPEGWHHTPQDTMDKVSAHSLQISADLLLETIHLIDKR